MAILNPRSVCGQTLSANIHSISYTGFMSYFHRYSQTDEYRREELLRKIEHSLEKLTLQELESLYYDMSTKSYIND